MIRARISRIHAPVTTLGPGRRLGIWFQGCSIGCRGCVSRDTWDAGGSDPVDIADVADHAIRRISALALTGVTISGGEPFEQPDALLDLLKRLRGATLGWDLDILCYSGLPRRIIEGNHTDHLVLLDALIPEPFNAKAAGAAQWRGSSNQPVVLLSDLARERYSDPPAGPAGMQVSVEDGRVWLIGVPRHKDMDRLASLAATKGLLLEDLSWLA